MWIEESPLCLLPGQGAPRYDTERRIPRQRGLSLKWNISNIHSEEICSSPASRVSMFKLESQLPFSPDPVCWYATSKRVSITEILILSYFWTNSEWRRSSEEETDNINLREKMFSLRVERIILSQRKLLNGEANQFVLETLKVQSYVSVFNVHSELWIWSEKLRAVFLNQFPSWPRSSAESRCQWWPVPVRAGAHTVDNTRWL